MSLTEPDRKLWCAYVADVTPIRHTHVIVPASPQIKFTPKQVSHVSPILDLHGMTLSEAHAAVLHHVQQMKPHFPYVTIITGKSGVMKQELPVWVNNLAGVTSCEHDRGGGAYRITFKRDRQVKK